jgi:type IV pilus assembly protein PilA
MQSTSTLRHGQRRRPGSRGFSLIELLIVIAIILVILAVAVPNYNKYQMRARELGVIQEMQTIYGAQISYYSQFGKYAANLTELGPPASGADGPQGANLIPRVLAEGSHNGYRFTVAGTAGGWSVTAVPEQFGVSGGRTFYMDQGKTIHQNFTAEPANANSPELR